MLPNGALLLSQHSRGGGLTLCRTQSALPIESSEKQVTLCFDKSVQLISLESERNGARVLSALEPFLRQERHSLGGSECIACSDSSHWHVTVECMSEPSGMLSSGFVSSFIELPSTLLSISLIQMNDGGGDNMSSPLAQACIKRLLVGYHVVFFNDVTSEISISFQEKTLCFRVASILPNPNRSTRTQVSLCLVGEC